MRFGAKTALSLSHKWIVGSFFAVMGVNHSSLLKPEQLEEFEQLTYLKRSEINYILKKFSSLGLTEIRHDLLHRFSRTQIEHIFQELKYNPFSDRIFHVFSTDGTGRLNFEEFLNLCSVFSANCPLKVKAAWAFLIYDFDEDNQITKADIAEMLDRLTRPQRLSLEEKEHIGDMLLEDMDLQHLGGINQVEFLHAMTKIPDFAQIFSFKP